MSKPPWWSHRGWRAKVGLAEYTGVGGRESGVKVSRPRRRLQTRETKTRPPTPVTGSDASSVSLSQNFY